MRVIHLAAKSDADGVLHLSVPLGVVSGEFEVAIVVSPKISTNGSASVAKSPEELGWPPGYFEHVIGSVRDETFVAPPRQSVKPIMPLDLG